MLLTSSVSSLASLVCLVFVGHELLGWAYAIILLPVLVAKEYILFLGCIASCENLGLVDDIGSVPWALGLTGSVTSSCQSTYNAIDQLLKKASA